MSVDQQSLDNYVEELRTTGLHGHEPWVAGLDWSLGTLIATLRQMEVCVEQMASVCLDAEFNHMDNRDTWEFIRTSFLPRLVRLTDRLDGPIRALAAQLESQQNGSVLIAWPAMKSLVSRLTTDDAQSVDCAKVVLPLLFAVIALQGTAHRAVNPNGNGDISGATNLAPAFLQRCSERLGWPPSAVGPEVPLEDLAGRVGVLPLSGHIT